MRVIKVGHNKQVASNDNHDLDIDHQLTLENYDPNSFTIEIPDNTGTRINVNTENFFTNEVLHNPFFLGINNNKYYLIQYAIFRLDNDLISKEDKALLSSFNTSFTDENHFKCRYVTGDVEFVFSDNKVISVITHDGNILTNDLIFIIVSYDNGSPVIIPFPSFTFPYDENNQQDFLNKLNELGINPDTKGIYLSSNLKLDSRLTKVNLKYDNNTIDLTTDAEYITTAGNPTTYNIDKRILNASNKTIFVFSKIVNIKVEKENIYVALFPSGIRIFGDDNDFITKDDGRNDQLHLEWHFFTLETRLDQYIFSKNYLDNKAKPKSNIFTKAFNSGIIGIRYPDMSYKSDSLEGFIRFRFITYVNNVHSDFYINKGDAKKTYLNSFQNEDFEVGRMYKDGNNTYIELYK
jgi:hypothetical protein